MERAAAHPAAARTAHHDRHAGAPAVTAAPTIAPSAIGVSMTRSAPKRSSIPSVTLKAPP
jgi:hypothetical protein